MSSDRIDFLYKQERADPETFLLGRKIEKAEHMNTFTSAAASARALGGVEGLHSHSTRTELQKKEVGGTMSAEEIEAQRVSIDMQAKMRDDPLFLIRKREEEDKREMLKNPLKMMQLQKMMSLVSAKKQGSAGPASSSASAPGGDDEDNLLKQYLKILQQKNEEKALKASKLLTKDDDHRKRRSRRSRTRSRSRSRSSSSVSSSSSTSSSNSGNELLEKYMNALKQKEQMVHKLRVEEQVQQQMERKAEQRKERQRLQPGGGIDTDEEGGAQSDSSSQARTRTSHRRPERDRRYSKPEQRSVKAEPRHYDAKSDRGKESGRYKSRSKSRSRSRDRRRRSRSSSRNRHSHRHGPRRSRSRSRSPRHQNKTSQNPKGRKLSPATMERRRQEMAMAAQERNVERVSNVQRYAEEERKEIEKEDEIRKQSKSSFLQGTMLDHADRSSVGDRVQRNKFNVQRKGNDVISGGEKFLKR